MKHERHLKALIRHWPQILPIAAAMLLAAGFYFYKLGRFVGHSPTEVQTAASNISLRLIADNPLNLPYKALDYVFLHLPAGSLEARSRMAAGVIALACGVLFYLLARRWHGTRNAVLGTLIFVLSSWMLQTGRFGAGLVMFSFLVLGIIALSAWISTAEVRGRNLIAYTAGCAVALLVPAGIWFVAAASLILRPVLQEQFADAGQKARLASAAVLVLSLGTVAFAIVRDTALLFTWLGVPQQLPYIFVIAKQAAGSLSYLVARGPLMPEVWLAHTPVLDAAVTALLVLGIVFYVRRSGNARVRLLMACAGISAILVAFNGAPALAYLVPIAYLVATTGLAYLLHKWFSVFPRNPIARSLALACIAGLVLCVTVFHTQRSFIAWRQNPETAEAYRAAGSALKASNLIQ